MIGHCQKPTGHGTCGGELRENFSAEGGKTFVHTACVRCNDKPLLEPFELKGVPPSESLGTQLGLDLKFSF